MQCQQVYYNEQKLKLAFLKSKKKKNVKRNDCFSPGRRTEP